MANINIPAGGILNPSQLRAKAIMEEERKRLGEIAEKVIAVLNKEKVSVEELPRIVQMITGRINQKIDKSNIETILNL